MVLTILNPMIIHNLKTLLLSNCYAFQRFKFISNYQLLFHVLELILLKFWVDFSTHRRCQLLAFLQSILYFFRVSLGYRKEHWKPSHYLQLVGQINRLNWYFMVINDVEIGELREVTVTIQFLFSLCVHLLPELQWHFFKMLRDG